MGASPTQRTIEARDASAVRVLVVGLDADDGARVERATGSPGAGEPMRRVATLAQARRVADSERFDLIVVAARLPDAEGAEAVSALRLIARDVPLVVVADEDDDDVAGAALGAGADDVLLHSELGSRALYRALRNARHRRTHDGRRREEWRGMATREAQSRGLVDAVETGIVVVDGFGYVLHANPAAQRLLGRTLRDGVWSAPWLTDAATRLVAVGRGGVRVVADDGLVERGPRYLAVAVRPIEWDGLAAHVATLHEVTDSLLPAPPRREEASDGVSRLAAGVAHELNSALNVVLVNIESMAVAADDPDQVRGLAHEIEVSARRATELVEQILDYGGRRRVEPVALDLGPAVTEIVEQLRGGVPPGIVLDVATFGERHTAAMDRAALRETVRALVQNAVEAMPHGGALTVEVRHDPVAPAVLGSTKAPAGSVRVTVRDSGKGIPTELQPRVFEPFVSTKKLVEGSGLGLARVEGLVRQLGGGITLTSRPGRGTSVSLHFPVVAREGDPDVALDPPVDELRGSETVLFVEDEPELLAAGARVLRRFGYDVRTAGDGLRALEVLADDPGAIDIVVTDVVMPHLDGRALHAAVRRLPSPPPVLFVSGYSTDDLDSGDLLDPSLPLLTKPWSIPGLLRGIRQMLDNRSTLRAPVTPTPPLGGGGTPGPDPTSGPRTH